MMQLQVDSTVTSNDVIMFLIPWQLNGARTFTLKYNAFRSEPGRNAGKCSNSQGSPSDREWFKATSITPRGVHCRLFFFMREIRAMMQSRVDQFE